MGCCLLTSGAAIAQAGGCFEQATAADLGRCLSQGAEEVLTRVLLGGALVKQTDHLQGDVKGLREDVNDLMETLRKSPP